MKIIKSIRQHWPLAILGVIVISLLLCFVVILTTLLNRGGAAAPETTGVEINQSGTTGPIETVEHNPPPTESMDFSDSDAAETAARTSP